MDSDHTLSLQRIARALEKARAGGVDIWLSDDTGLRGIGRLLVRASAGGTARLYLRYTLEDRRRTVPLGPFSKNARPGFLTLRQARDLAWRHAAELFVSPSPPSSPSRRNTHASSKAQPIVAGRTTLQDLCNAYVKLLFARGKSSAQQVANAFRLSVTPSTLANVPAAQISSEQICDLLRAVIARGAGASASSLRSHLHAAYSMAIGSSLDPSIPAVDDWKEIQCNPVSGIASLSGFRKARKRALEEAELAELLHQLLEVSKGDFLPAVCARAILLNLYLGGQRGEQLLSVPLHSVNLDGQPVATIALLDPKGARTEPRLHVLPIEPAALPQVRWFVERSQRLGSRWLLCSAAADVKLRQTDLSKLVRQLSRAMLKEGSTREPFQFIDLRRTVETRLAAMGVSQDTRAQLLSHGISGIQATHYDMWDYMPQKREAMRLWHDKLQELLSRPRRTRKA